VRRMNVGEEAFKALIWLVQALPADGTKSVSQKAKNVYWLRIKLRLISRTSFDE
jgi:hypothetical protein